MWAPTLLASGHFPGASGIRRPRAHILLPAGHFLLCQQTSAVAGYQRNAPCLGDYTDCTWQHTLKLYFLAWEPLHSLQEFLQPAWALSHLGGTDQRLTVRTGAWKRVVRSCKERHKKAPPHTMREISAWGSTSNADSKRQEPKARVWCTLKGISISTQMFPCSQNK